MMVIDSVTGQKAKFSSEDTIIEAYKNKNIVDGKVLYLNNNRYRLYSSKRIGGNNHPNKYNGEEQILQKKL